MPTSSTESHFYWYYYEPKADIFIASTFQPIEPENSTFSNRCKICDAGELLNHNCNLVIAYHPYAGVVCRGNVLSIADTETTRQFLGLISRFES